MILPIYVYGQPVLRKVAEDIAPDYPNLKELIANMFETMDNAEGVGLAAPQVGLPVRVVVVDLDVLSEDYPEYKGFRKAYINPHILEVSGEEVSMEEGCLSLPGIHEAVKRGNKIHVTYMDEDMVEHDEIVEGYLARVMQHEFDHLEGKMFIDHLSPLRKQMIKGRLNAMLKGKAHCTYKVNQPISATGGVCSRISFNTAGPHSVTLDTTQLTGLYFVCFTTCVDNGAKLSTYLQNIKVS